MRTEELHCPTCASHDMDTEEHIHLGFVPQTMFEDDVGHQWIKAAVCKVCGSLHAVSISERELDWAERRFLRALVDTNNMSEEEAREILGM